MCPEIHFAGRAFPSYHVFLMLAFVVGVLFLLRDNRRHPHPLQMSFALLLWLIPGALIGAKLMHVALDGFQEGIYSVFIFWRGGYYFHGGLLGGIGAYILYLACNRNNLAEGLDLIVPYVALGEAITRVGCFLSGCCWGTVAAGFPGVMFPPGSHAYRQHLEYGWIDNEALSSLNVHPVQLYMSLAMVALFFFLRYLSGRRAFRGEVVLHYLVWHCCVRFGIEFMRGDLTKDLLGLSLTQWIALVVLVPGFIALATSYRRPKIADGDALPAKNRWGALSS